MAKKVLKRIKYVATGVVLIYIYLGLVSLTAGHIVFEGQWYAPWRYVFEKCGLF